MSEATEVATAPREPRIPTPLPSWLWPDDRTDPAWYDKHDERL